MRTFRLLRADEIEVRISEIGKEGNYLTLLLYKTARTDASLLDETFGVLGWANDYKIIDGKMYCGIGIRDKETSEWIWKWNVGTESNTEAEKGEASDALKRAGFVWGIGTELYSSPRIYVNSGEAEIKKNPNGKYVCYDKFVVKKIEYDASERISALEIVNAKSGKTCFTMKGGSKATTQKVPAPTPTPKQEIAQQTPAPAKPAPGRQTAMGYKGVCRRCKAPIDQQTEFDSMALFGLALCPDCQRAAAEYKNRQKMNAG